MITFRLLTDEEWAPVAAEFSDKSKHATVRASINKAIFRYVSGRPIEADDDLIANRKALIGTATAFRDAYIATYNDEALDAVIEHDRDFLQRLDNLISESEQALAVLQSFVPKRQRGGNRDKAFEHFINSLIYIGAFGGLNIGASSFNGRGGPMVRYLQAATRHVLGSEVTVGVVRGWIRVYQEQQPA